MRVVFLVLVLVNLGFAAWHAWFSTPVIVTRPIRPDAASIQLYADAGTPSAVLTQEEPERESSVSSRRAQRLVACISIGPLSNRVDVEDAMRTLSAGGFRSTQRVSPGEVWLGRWVYIDAIETQAEANEIVSRLAQNGITEAYVIADGNNGNIVSLGVFSVAARAQQRFADAESLGYMPTVTDRSQPGDVFWLDVTVPGQAQFTISDLPRLSIVPEARYEECPAEAED